MKRLLVCDAGFNAGQVFRDLFDVYTTVWSSDTYITENDTILFEGGTDVNPRLYGEPQGKYTQEPDNKRDAFERKIFNRAKQVGASMIGICRGAQFLCVMSGGSLIQHVNNHGGDHSIVDYLGDVYTITSTHHQMMYPFKTEHELVASSVHNRSTTYLDGYNRECDVPIEPEIVWFPKTRALSIQGHPEFMSYNSIAVEKVNDYVNTFIFGDSK